MASPGCSALSDAAFSDIGLRLPNITRRAAGHTYPPEHGRHSSPPSISWGVFRAGDKPRNEENQSLAELAKDAENTIRGKGISEEG